MSRHVRRRIVAVDADLRATTLDAIAATRRLLDAAVLPPPRNDDRCRACSLREVCQPEIARDEPDYTAQRAALFNPDD